MKSYFWEGPGEFSIIREELRRLLPGQADPWLLLAADGDPIAFFNVEADRLGNLMVQADISGRHFSENASVLAVLRQLQDRMGGILTDDNDNAL